MSSINSIPAGVCSQKLWGLIFLALELWSGGPGVGLGLRTPEISFLNFYILHVDVGPARSDSIVVRLPFNLISDGSE